MKNKDAKTRGFLFAILRNFMIFYVPSLKNKKNGDFGFRQQIVQNFPR